MAPCNEMQAGAATNSLAAAARRLGLPGSVVCHLEAREAVARASRDTESLPSSKFPPSFVATLDDQRCDGTWLDEDLRVQGDRGRALLESVLQTLRPHLSTRTQRRGDHLANFELRVECLIANGLRALFYRAIDRVSYHTGSNRYLGRGRWLSAQSLRETIKLLANLDLLSVESGTWGGPGSLKRGHAATYRLHGRFRMLIDHHDLGPSAVCRVPPARNSLVRLRAEKDKRGNAADLLFVSTDQTDAWATAINEYNLFATQHVVDLDLHPSEMESVLNSFRDKHVENSRQPLSTRLELFDIYLRRVFNDGRSHPKFEHGGRMYGPWYQNVPKWARGKITIDGSETVELDYSGMAVRMAYHQRGLDYREDPYAISQLEDLAERQSFPRTHYREAVKRLLEAMINNQDDAVRPEAIRLDRSFAPSFTRAEVRNMLLQKHHLISDVFGTGLGKVLQRMDSDIALDVILNLMKQRIYCLPIHDSFIVKKEHAELLREQMISSYKDSLGFTPCIN